MHYGSIVTQQSVCLFIFSSFDKLTQRTSCSPGSGLVPEQGQSPVHVYGCDPSTNVLALVSGSKLGSAGGFCSASSLCCSYQWEAMDQDNRVKYSLSLCPSSESTSCGPAAAVCAQNLNGTAAHSVGESRSTGTVCSDLQMQTSVLQLR